MQRHAFFVDGNPDNLRELARVTIALLFFSMLYGAGCGGGGGTQPPTNAVLKVTGTSSGVNRSINLNLTVNH